MEEHSEVAEPFVDKKTSDHNSSNHESTISVEEKFGTGNQREDSLTVLHSQFDRIPAPPQVIPPPYTKYQHEDPSTLAPLKMWDVARMSQYLDDCDSCLMLEKLEEGSGFETTEPDQLSCCSNQSFLHDSYDPFDYSGIPFRTELNSECYENFIYAQVQSKNYMYETANRPFTNNLTSNPLKLNLNGDSLTEERTEKDMYLNQLNEKNGNFETEGNDLLYKEWLDYLKDQPKSSDLESFDCANDWYEVQSRNLNRILSSNSPIKYNDTSSQTTTNPFHLNSNLFSQTFVAPKNVGKMSEETVSGQGDLINKSTSAEMSLQFPVNVSQDPANRCQAQAVGSERVICSQGNIHMPDIYAADTHVMTNAIQSNCGNTQSQVKQSTAGYLGAPTNLLQGNCGFPLSPVLQANADYLLHNNVVHTTSVNIPMFINSPQWNLPHQYNNIMWPGRSQATFESRQSTIPPFYRTQQLSEFQYVPYMYPHLTPMPINLITRSMTISGAANSLVPLPWQPANMTSGRKGSGCRWPSMVLPKAGPTRQIYRNSMGVQVHTRANLRSTSK